MWGNMSIGVRILSAVPRHFSPRRLHQWNFSVLIVKRSPTFKKIRLHAIARQPDAPDATLRRIDDVNAALLSAGVPKASAGVSQSIYRRVERLPRVAETNPGDRSLRSGCVADWKTLKSGHEPSTRELGRDSKEASVLQLGDDHEA
jgi:hypothetical protein